MNDNRFRAWSAFLFLVVIVAVVQFAMGRFLPATQLDTDDYRNYPLTSSLLDSLNSKRTFVYPLFLLATETTSSPYMMIPYVQFAIAAIAAGVFMSTLMRCGWAAGLAFAATCPLMTGEMVLQYSGMTTPDALAQSLGILTVSCWLRIVWNGRGVGYMFLLSLLIFLCYQAKPSYLHLIGFVPVGGAIARWWLFGPQSGWFRIGSALSFCSILPFLAWCSFRWLIVGHFGLVSFGGYNVVGISGQMLRRDEVSRLSEDLQPLASAILDRRDQRAEWSSRMSYDVYESQFNSMVWEISVPEASKLLQDDPRLINAYLGRLSQEVIRLRPVRYCIWLTLAARRATTESISLTLANPISVCSLGLILGALAAGWLKSGRIANKFLHRSLELEYQTMVWLALGFVVSAMALVILVETPLRRYCAPAAVFLPCILSMRAYQMVSPWLNVKQSRGQQAMVDTAHA